MNVRRKRVPLRVAAYQAPLLPSGSMGALALIRERIVECEQLGVEILCCPEAILGGLADNARRPAECAIPADDLPAILAAIASERVTTIVGFTELGKGNRLYNSAAVLDARSVVGIYRKRHPAIRRSVYAAGESLAVFHVRGLSFGIVICNDSNDPRLAREMADMGAQVLFVPTNNGLPHDRHDDHLRERAQAVDTECARQTGMWVVRADVAGRNDTLRSRGSSSITNPEGAVVSSAGASGSELIVAELSGMRAPRQSDPRR